MAIKKKSILVNKENCLKKKLNWSKNVLFKNLKFYIKILKNTKVNTEI